MGDSGWCCGFCGVGGLEVEWLPNEGFWVEWLLLGDWERCGGC